MTVKSIRFGTRGSPLAMAQTQDAVKRIVESGEFSTSDVEIRVIKTIGDVNKTAPVSEIGGKGVFCKELEEALLCGEIDVAVHSMKDLPVRQPDGLIADCVLPRVDPRDALICDYAANLGELPDGAVIGTSSLRRSAQIRRINSTLKPINFRGNLDTRLRKLDEGEVDAAILAMAGLRRLGRLTERMKPIPVQEMLPAPAQGCVCLERRVDDEQASIVCALLNDPVSFSQALAERTVLSGLGGDCNTPLGAMAEVAGRDILIRGELLSEDGTAHTALEVSGTVSDAVELGLQLSRDILARAAAKG